MDDVEQFLRRQIGPFPVWQWIVIVIVGVLLAYAIRRAFPGDDAEGDGTPVDPFNPFAGTQPTGGAIFNPTYAGVNEGAGDAEEDEPEIPESNREWLARASALLKDTGSYSAAAVDQALRMYLQGKELDDRQYGIVDAALGAAGPPPEGAPPIRRARPPSDPGPTGGSGGGGSTPTTSGDDQLRAQIRAIFKKYGYSVSTTRLNRLVREVRGGRTLASIDKALAEYKASQQSSSTTTKQRTHTVKRGDTYWDLARRYYGDPQQWRKIANANPYPAREIPIGAKLVIPA